MRATTGYLQSLLDSLESTRSVSWASAIATIGFALALAALPMDSTRAQTVTVNLNDGNCSARVGDAEPCNVSDPLLAAAAFEIDGVTHSQASADIVSGLLRARTESTDLDLRVSDGQKNNAACWPDPLGDDPCDGNKIMLLQSPGGNLPILQPFDRIAITGFANDGNNGNFFVRETLVPGASYLLVRLFAGLNVGPAESDREIYVTRLEELHPLAAAQVEGLVLTYTDPNPYEVGSGRIGMTFDVDYSRLNVPVDGTAFDAENEMRVLFFAAHNDVSAGVVTNYIGGTGHMVVVDEGDGSGVSEEEFLLAGPALNMQLVQAERSVARYSGRVESTSPIALEIGDTLTIVNAFFRVGSAGDLFDDDEDGPAVPISISDGFTTAHLYGDFPPGLVANTEVPIDWPTEPPADEETLQVAVDIKPGSSPNCFNVNDHGVIPVAILGSTEFDASQIDATTLDFNGLAVKVRGNGNASCSLEDINDDGFLDLACRFEDDSAAWIAGDSDAIVSGTLFDGTAFEGTDSICLVPKN